MTSPERFLQPCFTTPPAAAMLDGLPQPAERAVATPLPMLVEPELVPVVDPAPSTEPLVPVAHRRIRTLSNYWHAGWRHAAPETLLRAGTAQRLSAVADSLPSRFGLAVFDAWRPLALQAELWDAAYGVPGLPAGYIADPIADPRMPPAHLTGATVDLTLTFDGAPLALGTGFDDFSPAAATAAFEQEAGVVRSLRRLLYWSMRSGGFVVLDCEWWHFEFGTRRWAAITGHEPVYGPASVTVADNRITDAIT